MGFGRRSRTSAAISLALVVIAVAGPLPAAAYGVIDQQQLEHPFASGGFSCAEGQSGGMMQGVTPGASQWAVVSVFLLTPEWSVGSHDITLEVRDAAPDGTAIASTVATVPEDNLDWVDFEFSSPVDLTPGSIVYLFLETNDDVAWAGTRDDVYGGGTTYGMCTPFTEPFAFGTDWGDFTFITYQPETPADPTDPISTAVGDLPIEAFAAPGHQTAMQARLDQVAAAIAGGDTAAALTDLTSLRRHVDGCADAGGSADRNDWITNCAAQLEIRGLIDALMASLGG